MSSDLNIFASYSEDQYINLYTNTTFKLYRSIYLKDFKCDHLFISSCPLNCIVLVNKAESRILVYSINGQYITQFKEESSQYTIKSPKLLKDRNFCEYLIYTFGVKLICRRLPFLEMKQQIALPLRKPEYIDVADDYNTIYISNNSGDEVIYIKNYAAKK